MIAKIENSIPKLIFLVLITTIISTTFSLSRFETAKAGTNDVKVASFIVDANGSNNDSLSIDCNTNAPNTSYDVVVTNKKDNLISQVAIKYDLVIEFSESLPTGLTLTDGKTTLNSVDGKTTYVFSDVGDFKANVEDSKTHTITLTGSNEVLSIYDGTMSIYVDATQID